MQSLVLVLDPYALDSLALDMTSTRKQVSNFGLPCPRQGRFVTLPLVRLYPTLDLRHASQNPLPLTQARCTPSSSTPSYCSPPFLNMVEDDGVKNLYPIGVDLSSFLPLVRTLLRG